MNTPSTDSVLKVLNKAELEELALVFGVPLPSTKSTPVERYVERFLRHRTVDLSALVQRLGREQLKRVLKYKVDAVLLDNMAPAILRE
ncbi:MAG: hypothetical protein MUF54_19100, partial [Polyangiaceae bacterium]|nr:hypothetical protein [Polyangiaceae bacterium]